MRWSLSISVLVAALAVTGAVPAASAQAPATTCDVQLQVVENGRRFAESQLAQLAVRAAALEAELKALKEKK